MQPTHVVTGGASGIGAATVALLRSRGGRVITVDRHEADVVADLSTSTGRRQAVAQIGALTDRLDGVIACAGVAGLSGTDPEVLVSVNYFGAVDLVEGLRPLLAEGSGVVLLSSNSVTCQPGWSRAVADACLTGDEPRARAIAATSSAVLCYPATKAALAWWVRRETRSWARDGIRLNAVAPGLVATPMTHEVGRDPVFGKHMRRYPSALDRPGRPEEIAEVIAFLVSPAASVVAGSVWYADGGTDAMRNPRRPRGTATTGRLTSRAAGAVVRRLTRRR